MRLVSSLLCATFLAGLATISAQANDTTTATAPPDTSNTTASDASANITDDGTTNATATTEVETTTAPPAGVTDSANATTDNSTVEGANNTEAANETNTTPGASTSTVPPSTTSKGVSEECYNLYESCTTQEASDSLRMKKYCDAFQAAESCIKDGKKENNTVEICSTLEHERLGLLDCGPADLLNTSVSDVCLARITECLSTAQDVSKLSLEYTYKKFFCDSYVNSKSCLTTQQNGTKCTSNEYTTIEKSVPCSSTRALISGALLITMYLLQSILGEN